MTRRSVSSSFFFLEKPFLLRFFVLAPWFFSSCRGFLVQKPSVPSATVVAPLKRSYYNNHSPFDPYFRQHHQRNINARGGITSLKPVAAKPEPQEMPIPPPPTTKRNIWNRIRHQMRTVPNHDDDDEPETTISAAAMMSFPIFSILSFVTSSATRPFRILSNEIWSLTIRQKVVCAIVFALGVAVGKVSSTPQWQFWKRYTKINDIPSSFFGPDAPLLKGRAVSISDGDTIRFWHQPTPWHSPTLPTDQKMSNVALPIRICTVDTPETAKFGKPGQPFGQEAKQALVHLLAGDNDDKQKTVFVRLLQKDQYNRAVAQVFVQSKWLKRKTYVDEYLLKQGLAEVYRGGGALYGPKGFDFYVQLEQAAQQQKVGIWSQTNRESAAEYKKRTKQ